MLEMKVYREIQSYEAKVMFGRSWRQLAAIVMALVVIGVVFGGLSVLLHALGWSWKDATNLGMYVVFPLLIPIAAWGWWRPKGLKPEQYIHYITRYYLKKKVITYADTYEYGQTPQSLLNALSAATSADTSNQSSRKEKREAKREAKQLKRAEKLIPEEHVFSPQKARRTQKGKR